MAFAVPRSKNRLPDALHYVMIHAVGRFQIVRESQDQANPLDSAEALLPASQGVGVPGLGFLIRPGEE